MDFLPVTDEANDPRPIGMAIEAGEEERRLGSIGRPSAPLHEARGLLAVPGPLGLVENDDVVGGGSRIPQALVAKMMDVLNEHPCPTAGVRLRRAPAGATCALDPVPGKGFLEHGDERPVAGEMHSRFSALPGRRGSGEVETDQGLPRPGDTRHETHAFPRSGPILRHEATDERGGLAEVPRLAPKDLAHVVRGVKSTGRLNNRGARPIAAAASGLHRERGASGAKCMDALERVREPLGVAVKRAEQTRERLVLVPAKLERDGWGIRGDQDGGRRHRTARLVEVLEIEGVIRDLLEVTRWNVVCPTLNSITMSAGERKRTASIRLPRHGRQTRERAVRPRERRREPCEDNRRSSSTLAPGVCSYRSPIPLRESRPSDRSDPREIPRPSSPTRSAEKKEESESPSPKAETVSSRRLRASPVPFVPRTQTRALEQTSRWLAPET
jgi:hypothetical protein